MGKRIASNSIAIVIIAAIGWGLNYLLLPAWNIRSSGMWWFVLIMLVISTVVFAIKADFDNYDDEDKPSVFIAIGVGILTGLVLIAMLVIGIVSAKWTNASKYQVIAQVEQGNFEAHFSDISEDDNSNLAVVDLDTAIRVGNRTIGNLKHSSWFEVDDEYNLIIYQGQQYRISPLNYGGLFKYNKANYDGIPGYVLVDAQTQEAQFVEVEGAIKYSPSAYWANDLRRHLRNQYPSYIFGSHYFEIDEEGKTYWITAVQTPTIGVWGGAVEGKFILTDAQSGKSEVFKTEELPEWVDHSFGLEYLMNIAYYHYEDVNGFWNSVFSATGVYRTAYAYADEEDSGFAGYNSFVDKNGDVCFYTGLTPANSAESNVGFLLINTRTGQMTQYDCAGAEESSAQDAAEGQFTDLGYKATFPTVVNVCGEETYFMCMKDKAGLIQRYSFVNIENYSIVAAAETIDDAIAAYATKLGKDVATEEVVEEETKTTTATITEVYTAEIDGTTYFYYQLYGHLYKSSIKLNENQVTFKKGDKITVEYLVEETDIRIVTSISISN